MKISPLQLREYYVTEFHFTLNSGFRSDHELQLKADELIAGTDCKRVSDNPRQWVVTLELRYQPAAETNTPYIFSLGLVGMFEISPKFDEGKIDRLIQTNGPSVLFGIGREIIREQTARGPEGPFILPSASFLAEDPGGAPVPVVLPTLVQ
ncbi:MAG TPA: hypothetical protein VMF06_12340 [Candidatus Limnocylindria bacterium]|jgi:preprotein translocase subunit SecB|nr:hypothetical protein [Candidatus Limnocylindria bacterium]